MYSMFDAELLNWFAVPSRRVSKSPREKNKTKVNKQHVYDMSISIPIPPKSWTCAIITCKFRQITKLRSRIFTLVIISAGKLFSTFSWEQNYHGPRGASMAWVRWILRKVLTSLWKYNCKLNKQPDMTRSQFSDESWVWTTVLLGSPISVL